MDRNRPMRYQSNEDPAMYDDQPYADDFRGSSSQDYHTWKDDSRTPPRASVPGRTSITANNERRHKEDRYESYDRGYDRSRSPRRDVRAHYTDRDREGYQSPRRDRSRSRSPYFGGPPNRNVILEGLPFEWTQEDILKELQHIAQHIHLEGLEEVRLIKDKRTGQSKGFAFAQFERMSEARSFLERYYPTVPLYGTYDPNQSISKEPTHVRIAFGRERDDRERIGKGDDDWKCDICFVDNFSHRTLCFRCNAPRTRATANGLVVAQGNMSAFSGFATTGDSDVSPDGVPSQFLLLRGLEPGVNEELLAKGVAKLHKVKASTPPSNGQGFKKRQISSTTNDASLGAKEGSLQRVLLVRDRKSGDSWRYGFAEFSTVDDAQAAMVKYNSSEKFTISSKSVTISYIHAGVFVPILHQVGDEYAKFTFSPLSNAAVKLMYWDEAAYASELVTAIPPQNPAGKSKESKHTKLALAAAKEGLINSGTDGEPRLKKRKMEKETKVVASHLQFWTNRHAEIHGLPQKEASNDTATLPSSISEKTPKTDDPPSQTFADLKRKCCLLCSRQFKTEAEVNKHVRMSQLHRDNLKNDVLVSKAAAKLKRPGDATSDDTYRDRARERRQAFNQPKQPAAQHGRSKDSTQTSVNKQEIEDPPAQSKGATLLGKMGWNAGEGLGALGTGRTDAIVTELYSQGVGLGAQGGKIGDAAEEAHRQTKGTYADFLNKTKDKAKERYESLG
ncbi:related to RNA binding motif protein [Rhynchosporium agropyri]|uniref:Related to RNA binding motif protein n=1 Tax=Rhynchosporium agropyri TaxID=914238 RepID=A0A1E1K1G1_9HELO|nr:related to RNA binding motif protein [Rhynchosporium agropyri]